MKHICTVCNTEWEEDVTVSESKDENGYIKRRIITCSNCGEQYVYIPDDEECKCSDCESKCEKEIH
jgi:hypothetical protein